MSAVTDFQKVGEAAGDYVYFKAGEGVAALKAFKKTNSGKYAAEFYIVAGQGDNAEGTIVSQLWNMSWESHVSNLKSFLTAISRDPMPVAPSEFAKVAVSFIGEEQPLRGRVVSFKSEFKTKKDGTLSNFADVQFTRLEQDDAAVAKVRANLE